MKKDDRWELVVTLEDDEAFYVVERRIPNPDPGSATKARLRAFLNRLLATAFGSTRRIG